MRVLGVELGSKLREIVNSYYKREWHSRDWGKVNISGQSEGIVPLNYHMLPPCKPHLVGVMCETWARVLRPGFSREPQLKDCADLLGNINELGFFTNFAEVSMVAQICPLFP